MLRLEVAPIPDGLEVTGALSTSGPRRTPESKSTKLSELGFHALLTDVSQEVRFLRILGYGQQDSSLEY